MRLRPVRLLGVGCEQAVRERAQPPQRPARALVEACLVAQLVDQRKARYDDHRLAHHVEPVDWAVFACEVDEILYRRTPADGQEIADQRFARRMGNRIERVAARHVKPPEGTDVSPDFARLPARRQTGRAVVAVHVNCSAGCPPPWRLDGFAPSVLMARIQSRSTKETREQIWPSCTARRRSRKRTG